MASERGATHVHLRWCADAATGARWEILGPGDAWEPLPDASKRSSQAALLRVAKAWARARGVTLARTVTLDVVKHAPSGTDEPPVRTVGKAWPPSWRQLRPGDALVLQGRAGVLARYVLLTTTRVVTDD